MKRFLCILLTLLVSAGTASAKRLQVGLRGGANFSDYRFPAVEIDGTHFTSGPVRTGYEGGLVLRLNLSRHLHLQSELDYAFVNYAVNATTNGRTRRIGIRTERLEVPVHLGFQFGPLRLFGGAQFRLSQTQRSSASNLLRIGFNDSDMALTGGAGLKIRKFFLEFRVTGYPGSRTNEFRSGSSVERVRMQHHIVYGSSIGFFF